MDGGLTTSPASVDRRIKANMSGEVIFLQNISTESSQDIVQLYIENGLPGDVIVQIVKFEDGKAIVSLSREVKDDEWQKLQEFLENKSLKDSYLQALRLPPKISVSELPADVSQEMLELHFEYAKYGGGEIEAYGVQHYEQQQCAVITFKKEATVKSVLAYDNHVIHEKPVKVQRWDPMWKPTEVKRENPPVANKSTEAMDDRGQGQTSQGHKAPPPEPVAPAPEPVAPPPEPVAPHNEPVAPPTEPVAPPPEPAAPHPEPVAPPDEPVAPHPEPVAPPPEVMRQKNTEIPATKYQYLKESIRQKCVAHKVQILSDDEAVGDQEDEKIQLLIEGSNEALQQVELYIFQALCNVNALELERAEVAEILNKPKGKSEVEERLQKLKVKLVEIKGRWSIVGESEDCDSAESEVESMFCTESIKLLEQNHKFMKTDVWREAVRSVQGYGTVLVKEKGQTVLELVGIDEEVKQAKATLLQTLKKHSFKEETLEVMKGVYQFIRKHLQDEIQDIRSKHEVQVKLYERDGKCFLQWYGCADNVTAAKEAVKKMKDSVAYGTEECGKPGLAKYFGDRNCEGFQLAKSVETLHECNIEIRTATGGGGGGSGVGGVRRLDTMPQLSQPPCWIEARASGDDIGASGGGDSGASGGDDSGYRLSSSSSPEANPVKIFKGDIVKVKADVIVNSVANASTDLSKCSAVAAKFAKSGGAAMCEQFKSFGGLKCGEVKATLPSESVNYKVLLHVGIRAWDGERTYKMLCNVVKECLAQVRKYSFKSIVFPTLGCGKLKYPVGAVAKCLQEMTDQHGKGLQVKVVAFEEDVFRSFKSCLRSPDAGRPGSAGRPGRSGDTKVTFHINSRNIGAVKTIQTELQELISRHYREETVKDSCLETIEKQDKAKIFQLNSDLVIVDLDVQKKLIKIMGESMSVNTAHGKVKRILKEIKKKQDNPDYARKFYGPKAVLQAVLKQEKKAPAHWTRNQKVYFKVQAFSSKSKILADVDGKMFKAVENLVIKSWQQKFAGLGADSTGLKRNSKIKVKKVQRIENPVVDNKYRTALRQACEKGMNHDFPSIKSDRRREADVLTAVLRIPELDAIRLKEVNEYFLFHGTKVDKVEHLVLQGMDIRMSGKGLFGPGVYLAESSTKADQYADPKDARAAAGSNLSMVICRVLLGHVYHENKVQSYKRPPCSRSGCHKDNCPHTERFDSLMGTQGPHGRLNFREFVIYDNERVYPEFLVTYQRI